MEVVYRLEQSIERLCAFQICDNHTTFLQLLAAFAVAVAAAVVVVVVRIVAVDVVRLDDVGRDPHLHGAAAARRGADGGPADERALLVPEHSQRELGGGPADR